MKFNLDQSLEILERTPTVLLSLLSGLSEDWTHQNEGGDSWSAFDVVGHLLHGENTDWVPRIKKIWEEGAEPFTPYDRFAQLEENKERSLASLLEEFKKKRKENLEFLKSLEIDTNDYEKKGMHPALGEVRLEQLLATWTVHDLTHLAQISRVMARQYREAMGPWLEYFRLIQ